MDDPQNWQGLYRELSQVIGQSATLKLYHYFQGMQVSFPQRLLDPRQEANLMYQEYCSGRSVMQLAQRHNYAERSVRRILAKVKKREEKS